MKNKYLKAFVLALGVVGWSTMANAQFSEGFEGGTTAPTGWTVINQGDVNGWLFGAPTHLSSAHGGSNVAYIEYSSNAHDDYLVTEQFTVTAGTSDQLRFYAMNYSASIQDQFDVLISTTGTAASDFDTLIVGGVNIPEALTPSDSWQEYTYNLSDYTGQQVYIAFRAISTYMYYLYIDDVTLEAAPSCPAPISLTAANITGVSADIGWTEVGSAGEWQVEYGSTGFAQGTGDTVSGITTNPYTLGGLTSNSNYDYYVRSVCGANDTSAWAGPYSFTTPCDIEVAPWTYDVESAAATTSSAIEDCWSSNPSNVSYEYEWNVTDDGTTPSSLTGASSANSGTNYFYIEASNGSAGSVATLTTPKVDISALTYPSVQFYYFMYGSDIDHLTIEASDDNGVTWTTIGTISGEQQTSQSDPWQQKILPLTTYSSPVMIRFTGVSGGTYEGDICIDDISFQDGPSCYPPIGLTASNISETSADLNWVNNTGASEWQVEWGTTGFTQGTGTIVSNLVDTFTTVTLPTANTVYDFYIRTVCGPGDTSTWVGPYSFQNFYCVPTNTYSQNYYIEGVETNGAIQDIVNNGTGFGTNGYSDYTSDTLIVYPGQPIDITFAHPSSTYTYNVYVDWDNDLEFSQPNDHIISTGYVSSPYTMALTIPANIPVGTIARMRVRNAYVSSPAPACGSFNYGEAEDYILKITDLPSCMPPINLTINNLTATSVNMAWADTTGATQWQVEYGETGFVQGNGTLVSNIVDTFTNVSLTPNTAYEFYVRTVCGPGDSSFWAGPYSFLTPCTTYLAPFYEGFNNEVLPECWDNSTSEQWKFDGNPGYGATNNGRPAGTFAWADGSSPSSDSVALVTPSIDLTGLTSPHLSFEWFSNNEDYPGDNVLLIVNIYNGNSWVNLDTLSGDSTNWVYKSYDLSAYTNTVIRIMFNTNQSLTANSSFYNDILLDEIRVGDCVTGQDGTKNVCRLDDKVNLNSVITGAVPGGTWSSQGMSSFINGDTLNYQNLPTGTYNFQYVASTACIVSDTTIATINVYNPSNAGEDGTITVCRNEPIDLFGALAGESMDLGGSWYDPTYNELQNSVPLSGNIPGSFNYFYVVSNAACPADTAMVNVIVDGTCDWTGIQTEAFNKLSVYPNPTEGQLNIENPTNENNLTIVVLDMNGRVVLRDNTSLNNATKATISLRQLEKGIYTLKLFNDKGQKVFKIVKQ